MSDVLEMKRKETGAPVAATGIFGAGLRALNPRFRGVCKRTAPEKYEFRSTGVKTSVSWGVRCSFAA